MGSPTLDLVLDGIIKSEHLLEMATSGEWEQFLELEAQRQSILSALQLENLDLNEQQYVEIQNKMTQLITLNEQLEVVCRQQKIELSAKIQKFTQGNKAKKAYTE